MSSSLETIKNVVLPEEVDYFIQILRKFNLNEIGNENWLNCHEIILKLSQQAIIEANSYREETIKELLVVNGKLEILVHEIFCVWIWRIKILPKILEIQSNPPATFLIYAVIFHEGAALTLLELILFHQNGCESLGETAIDLVDYCVQAVTQLIGLVNVGHYQNVSKVDVDEPFISELERQKRDISYSIGLKCLTILNYLVDKVNDLLLSVAKRMVTVHDIPCLLSQILHLKPWLRKTPNGFEKFIDGKWVTVKGENIYKVAKIEAQTWFCFRQLLFNSNILKFYEINNFRRNELAKCQNLINETLLDQLPPLAELKHFLCTIRLTETKAQKFQNLLLEEIPQIKNKIMDNGKKYGGYKKIAEEQAKIFLTEEREDIFLMAKRLNEAYNFDFFTQFDEKSKNNENTETTIDKICGNCQKDAEKKCSNCLNVYYCSRDCQVANWPKHRNICVEINSKQQNYK